MDLPRVIISVLTVLAFGLASGGLFHAFTTAQSAARRVAHGFEHRRVLDATRDAEQAAIANDDALDADERTRLRNESQQRWIAAYELAGLQAPTIGNLGSGREPIAEALVRDLNERTRTDLWIAGAGLLLGLVASIWGNWL